jgi:SulP family sulfate permease
VLCGLLQGMPVGAGYSGTSANEAAGAQSRWAGLVAGAAILLMVWLLLRWIERIPLAVLAAIVIHAVSKSWRLSVFRPYLQWKRDRLLALAAVVAVLSLGILNGLLVAIAFSLILLLRQLAAARLSVLGRLADGHDFVDIAQHPDAKQPPGLLILRPEEPLFFANAESVMSLARKQVEQRKDLKQVVLSLEESPDLDSTALEALSDFSSWLQSLGIGLHVARLKDETHDLLLRAALPQLSPQALNNWSVEDAVLALAGAPSSTGHS